MARSVSIDGRPAGDGIVLASDGPSAVRHVKTVCARSRATSPRAGRRFPMASLRLLSAVGAVNLFYLFGAASPEDSLAPHIGWRVFGM